MRRTRKLSRIITTLTAFLTTLIMVTACGTRDPFALGSASDPNVITVGSQAYYSNETLAEIYAIALESNGFTVKRRLSIGQRDAYMPALTSGEITLFPEYTGNVLQFFNPNAQTSSPDEVYAQLVDALPEGLSALNYSPATDQDSYTVTAEYAKASGVESLNDLGDQTVRLGGPAELERRAYGPDGLKQTYGINTTFVATGDTTVDDLIAGTVDMANVFSADPRIQTQGLVVLDDPKNLVIPSNVVPLVATPWKERVAPVIDPISAALTPQDLIDMNVKATDGEQSSRKIARDWLRARGFIG